tara:strand:- start:19812 stop:19991 length:180 start_codon:yes stop_codon:yes gene_type:complete
MGFPLSSNLNQTTKLEVYKASIAAPKYGWSFRSNHDIIARVISQEDATHRLPPALANQL